MRDLPDFAAIRCNRCRGENAKIHDEHLAATEAYVDWLVEAFEAVSGFDIVHSKITASVLLGWVMKSLTTPVLRSMRATLKPSKLVAPVPVGIEPVSAMKISPL